MADNSVKMDPSYMYDQRPAATVKRELDRDAFLKILITQLQYQDPSEPMKDKEFIAQMAQFSSLEQMNRMASSNLQLFQVNQMTLGSQMLGKIVSYLDADGQEQTGEVVSVKNVGGVVQVQVGENMVDLSVIEQVKPKSS